MSIEVGQTAPDFALPAHDGDPVQLSALRGASVVVAFFPLAFSGVCSKQFAELGDGAAEYAGGTARVLAISVDHTHSQRAFAEKLGTTGVSFLSDFQPRGEVARAYGMFNEERGFTGRAVFVIDADGVVKSAQVVPALEMPDAGDVRAAVAACGL